MRTAIMNRPLTTAALSCVLLLAWADLARAQDTTAAGAISGVVNTADGSPLAGVVLCLGGTSRCATTTSVGAFRIPDVRFGDFLLYVSVALVT